MVLMMVWMSDCMAVCNSTTYPFHRSKFYDALCSTHCPCDELTVLPLRSYRVLALYQLST